MEGRHIEIRGEVRAAGFRPWVARLAKRGALRGRVRNGPSGVLVEAFGMRSELDRFVSRLRDEPPAPAYVTELLAWPIPIEPVPDFRIVTSLRRGTATMAPDLPACDACLAELRDPSSRRFGYAFTSCARCGPGLSVSLDVPFSRAVTTMAPFAMCTDCRAEVADAAGRRHRAQAVACPACGPRLRLARPGGLPEAAPDPVAVALQALVDGAIVAVKALGGWHLVCDAGSESAVQRLRERLQRREKPFAVLVAGPAAAEALVHLDDAARALMASDPRPIVLSKRLPSAAVADAVAPGRGRLGVRLPFTPLDHLLAGGVGRPLVVTAGRRGGEPLCLRDGDAHIQLDDVADLFLGNDREIALRLPDPVAAVLDGRPALLRRSGGLVPVPLHLGRRLARPVLACGGGRGSAFCLATGADAWIGPPVSDLDTLDGAEAFRVGVARLERLLAVKPEVVAHDLDPRLASTRYAASRTGMTAVPVQRHHAMVASVMAEHGLGGPVIGVAFGGDGLGTDGATWGGEVLLTSAVRAERVATTRALPMPGGEAALREPWRLALAALDLAFDGAPPLDRLALFRAVSPTYIDGARRMVASGVHSPRTHGIGRWLDAGAAVVLERPTVSFDGQLSRALEELADPGETAHYPVSLDTSTTPWTLDPSPAMWSVVRDLGLGHPVPSIAAQLLGGVAIGTAVAVRAAASMYGVSAVALAGACFQSGDLRRRLRVALDGLAVYANERVPPGEGGLALGQAFVADAVARS